MTAGFRRVPIMKPNHCWTILHVSILAGLLLTLNAEGEDCETDIRVPHGTAYEALLGKDLTINCTVTFCKDSPPTISWYKSEKTPVLVRDSGHIKTKWKPLNLTAGISSLIFKKILRNDSGEYRCRGVLTGSHIINVSVSVSGDGGHRNVTSKNDTKTINVNGEPPEDLWMYVYFAAGIVGFVIIVIIISVVSMRGCKGKSKKETQTENWYVAIPMVEQQFPQAGLQPRGSPSAPPSRRSTRRKTPPSQPSELPLPRDNEHVYGKMEEDGERQRNTVEAEGGTVVYAALNHQIPARPVARPRRLKEETSEYAAIRV